MESLLSLVHLILMPDGIISLAPKLKIFEHGITERATKPDKYVVFFPRGRNMKDRLNLLLD